MSYEHVGDSALDYLPCRYGSSKLLFRGPRRSLSGDFIACLGGTETYGKFIERPFPALLEAELGTTCVNFGWLNAGIDAFLNDLGLFDVIANARVTVIQVVGAQNMSNRFYSVHPRRNDRFLSASPMLKAVFREVDFTEFHFNRHMLQTLKTISPERYELVRAELKRAWLARMQLLLNRIRGKTILLWFGDHAPSETPDCTGLGHDPLFVDKAMIEHLRGYVTDIVEVCASDVALAQGTKGMVFNEMESMAAAEMLGPMAHSEAAAALDGAVKRLL